MRKTDYDDALYQCDGCAATMPKPVGPENRLRCAICGYEAPKSEYKHTCWKAINVLCIIAIGVVAAIAFMVVVGLRYGS